jgi:hypothetical protein
MTTDSIVRELADRMEIHQVLMRYCRGVDRGYGDLLRGVYHEGAVDHHGDLDLENAEVAFAEMAVPNLDALENVGSHNITNYIIELDGDSAAVESYFLAYQPYPGEDGRELFSFSGGRYVDRFERRDGRWAISERTVVVDWSRANVPGEDWPPSAGYLRGGRREADASHGMFRADEAGRHATLADA